MTITPGTAPCSARTPGPDLINQVFRGPFWAVNNLAVQALVAAYATDKAVVDESSARAWAAVTEVTTE